MAIHPPTGTDPFGALGDAIPCVSARQDTVSSTGLIFRHHRQSWHPYLLHGGFTDTLLVWIYQLGPGVRLPGHALSHSL